MHLPAAGQRWIVALAAVAAAGCSDRIANSVDDTVVRDSAGIRVVESGPASPPTLQLSAEPLLVIGEMEGAPEYQLHNVRHVTRLSDGTTVIANSGSSEVRYYDADGRHLRSSGGQGGGPGEFQFIAYMRRLSGDTLLVYDSRSRRVTILDPAGTYVRDFTPALGGGTVLSRVAAATADGALLVTGGRSFPSGSVAYHRDTLKYTVMGSDSVVSLRPYNGMEASIASETSGQNFIAIMREVAFGRTTYVAAGADRFYIGSSDTYEVHEYGAAGAMRGIIRSAHVPAQQVTSELFERYVEATLDVRARAATERGRDFDAAAAKKSIEEAPRAPAVPLYGGLLADEAGGVWVKDYALRTADDQPARWTVFDDEGRVRGAIDLPSRFQPLYINADTVTGVITDEYDVQYVRVYTVGR